MNIILAEQDGTEKSFSKPSVMIGRDANECDISFDNTRFPMVSRRHAELRLTRGKWQLADLGSSYGTYLNGNKLTALAEIAAGNQIQFGAEGPVLTVLWFEAGEDDEWSLDAVPTPRVSSPPSSAEPVFPPTKRPENPVPLPADPSQAYARSGHRASLKLIEEASNQIFELKKPSSWIGRDPTCEIVFDASSATVSRRHASISTDGRALSIEDNNSFNGTLVNGSRITAPTDLRTGDQIQFGMGGPILRVFPNEDEAQPLDDADSASPVPVNKFAEISPKTMVVNLGKVSAGSDSAEPQLLMTIGFNSNKTLSIGRAADSDIRLDGLLISNSHARLQSTSAGVVIEDLNSTNGVFVNGVKAAKQLLAASDSVQIGTFIIRTDNHGSVNVFDTRSKMRIDAVGLARSVKGRLDAGGFNFFEDISLAIRPNEFVGLLGPSGAGKTSLMETLSGQKPASVGNVLVNNLDLYRHPASLKQSIGFVPQDDIIHRELTVYRTLFYIGKLRLSRDVSKAELSAIIEEVLDVTGLSDRRNVPVNQLSGGQRKRVSIAVELITKPSVIYLDEPTSGLDPGTEDKIMRLFRQIAESGRTVVMTTHAMENVRLFDKIAVMMRGKLIFFGKPEEALKFFEVGNFKELYEKLEDHADSEAQTSSTASHQAAENWSQKFRSTQHYRENISKPLAELGELPKSASGKRRRLGIFGSLRQWATLSRRYLEVLLKDKLNLAILILQAPIIALMTLAVMTNDLPRDFVYFVIALVAIWFGLSVAAREIIREQLVYKRERMFNLGIFPYIASKLFVLGIIVTIQCLFLFVPLKIFDLAGLMAMPGELFGLPQLWAMLLTAGVGVAIGLFVSTIARTPAAAASIVPLILIPQILFSGIVGVPEGMGKAVGLLMPSAWSFDTMKRFSTLDTLEPEGADPRGETKGEGLYKFVESENDRIIEKAERDVEDFKRLSAGQPYDASTENPLNEKLEVPEMKKLPSDRSKYVTFLNPWMNEVLNQLVLMLMFGLLLIGTLIALRLKDRE